MPDVIIFDLDGTLLSGDSMRTWITEQLKSHPVRFLCALVSMPVASILMKFKKTKEIGISIFLWIATYGLSKDQLQEEFRTFSIRIKNNSIPNLTWFQDGLLEIKAHLDQERRVILATGTPELLAKELLSSMDLDIEAVGTTLKNRNRGWISESHCVNEEKVRRLKKLNIQNWLATYSDDIKQDYPILMNGKYAYVINDKKSKQISYKLQNLQFLEWN